MFKFNWYNKFGTIPSSYREAMSYEEQILWLCQQIENLKLESGNYNYNMLENKPSINGITLLGNKTLTDLGIQGKLTAGSGIRIVGNTISATGGGSGGEASVTKLTSNLVLLPSTPLTLNTGFYQTVADENNNYGVYFHTATLGNLILGGNELFYFDSASQTLIFENKDYYYDTYETDWAIIEHTNITNEIVNDRSKIPTSQAVYNALQVTKLTSNLVLLPSTLLTLNTGFYQTVADENNNYGVYFHTATLENLILGGNELFYFDSASQTLIFENKDYYYDTYETDWAIIEHTNITNEIVNDRSKIPTSQAVYNALQNGNNYYTTLTSSLTFNMNGTNSANLTEGYYYLDSNVYYYSNGTLTSASFMLHTICYFSASLNEFYIAGNSRAYNRINYRLEYVDSTDGWILKELKTSDLLKTSNIVTSISEYSLDSQVPSAKTIYDYSNKDFMQIRNTSNYSVSSTGSWYKFYVPLTSLYNSSGSSFVHDSTNGKIIIGSGVSRVRAILTLSIQGATDETAPAINVKRNGQSNWSAIYPATSFTSYNSTVWYTVTLETFIDVNAGDEIMVGVNSHTVGTLTFNAIGTVLLLEKIY